MVRFKADINGNWWINKLIEEHIHELASPKERHLLRSHRSIHGKEAGVLQSKSKVRISTANAFSYIVQQVDGIGNVGFSKRDAYNFVNQERLLRIETGDAFNLLKLFRERKNFDLLFDWDVELDEEQRLTNFLWVDEKCKMDYNIFRDVIIFDTSYHINKYNLICAPLIGVNNHWQNILFGAAFLVDKTIISFE
ncbi:Protein FAR1-like sequence 5 [Apostasia shenzhenica]|uniref:Protein FAR1-like sequence 5 n=1 Tax=Apostasia shenzhenica TaxID=1088818 RepID=A0A2I0AVQ5_9ASPA|nr:Protein FAR1-like sequence 5 [Apostasia shenzhenica]